jgi:energy-coupling factor transporter ATP-binding protein EcfA2
MEDVFKNDITQGSHMLISGKTGSGKTRLLNELMRTIFKYKFDDIYIFTTTYEENSDVWDELHIQDEYNDETDIDLYIKIKQGVYDDYILREYGEWFINGIENNVLDEIMKLKKERQKILIDDIKNTIPSNNKKKRIYKNGVDDAILSNIFQDKRKEPTTAMLIIFDDVLKQLNTSKGYLSIIRNGRSRNISTISLTQRIIDTKPDLRTQYSHIWYFHNDSDYDVFVTFLGINSKEKTKLKNIFTRVIKKYDYIFADLDKNDIDEKLYLNTERITIKIK